MANGSESAKFSAENIWHEDPMPLGYHTGNSGKILPGGIWGEEAKREKIYKSVKGRICSKKATLTWVI